MIDVGLVEQEHVVESGTAKAVFELSDFGKAISEKLRGFTEEMGGITNNIDRDLREALMDVAVQTNSMKSILKGLDKRVKNNEISPQDYSNIKEDYTQKLKSLKKRENEIKQRLEK